MDNSTLQNNNLNNDNINAFNNASNTPVSENANNAFATINENASTDKKFRVKDIVFLAIMAAVCLLTCAVMPLVASLQTTVFGIASFITCFQTCLFYSIGLSKVPKTGALFIMGLLMGAFELMMAPAMFFGSIIAAIIAEIVAKLVFNGYHDKASIMTVLPLYCVIIMFVNVPYNYFFGREAMVAVLSAVPLLSVGMTIGVIILSLFGSAVGLKIAGELKKAGKI